MRTKAPDIKCTSLILSDTENEWMIWVYYSSAPMLIKEESFQRPLIKIRLYDQTTTPHLVLELLQCIMNKENPFLCNKISVRKALLNKIRFFSVCILWTLESRQCNAKWWCYWINRIPAMAGCDVTRPLPFLMRIHSLPYWLKNLIFQCTCPNSNSPF